MGSADVFYIVSVKVWVHRDAVFPERLVILRAGKRRQTKEFEKVNRQFSLMIAISRLIVSGVCREAQDIPRNSQDALLFPGE